MKERKNYRVYASRRLAFCFDIAWRLCRARGNDVYAYAGATAAFNTVYASASTGSGFSSGWSAGISPYMGLPISTNFTSVGVNYNITHDSWSGNLSAWTVDKNGWTFNPSVSAMFLEEQATNLVRGQGFRNNDQVLSRFVDKGNYQEALDYFGFKGKYDPSIEDPGQFNTGDGNIYFNDKAFNQNYDYLRAVYAEELFHSQDYLVYKSQAPDWMINEPNLELRKELLNNFEEWRAQNYLYKKQGLYPNSTVDWIQRINYYSFKSEMFTDKLFESKWWHSIYKIPRRW
jgi:hypothetical protein